MNDYYEKRWYDGKGGYWDASSAPWGKYSNEITSVKLTGVSKIGDYAFENFKKLSSVSGSGSISTFGAHAFDGCSALKSISLKDNAKMGSYVFAGTGLTQVIWPSENDTISTGAFQSCASIERIEIPSR